MHPERRLSILFFITGEFILENKIIFQTCVTSYKKALIILIYWSIETVKHVITTKN